MSNYSIEDIARFVEGDMDEAERSKFEQSLGNDESLRGELQHYQNVRSSLAMKLVEDDRDRALKQTLSQASKGHFHSNISVLPIRRYAIWASAAAAVFVLFWIWSPWQKDLYKQYSGTEMVAVAERGNGSSDADMQQAVEAFNKEDFATAKTLLQNLVAVNPADATSRYYYAISLLETGEIANARQELAGLYRGISVYKYDAAFYLALSFVKEHDTPKAKYWLKKIPEDAASYEKSQELLNKLK